MQMLVHVPSVNSGSIDSQEHSTHGSNHEGNFGVKLFDVDSLLYCDGSEDEVIGEPT